MTRVVEIKGLLTALHREPERTTVKMVQLILIKMGFSKNAIMAAEEVTIMGNDVIFLTFRDVRTAKYAMTGKGKILANLPTIHMNPWQKPSKPRFSACNIADLQAELAQLEDEMGGEAAGLGPADTVAETHDPGDAMEVTPSPPAGTQANTEAHAQVPASTATEDERARTPKPSSTADESAAPPPPPQEPMPGNGVLTIRQGASPPRTRKPRNMSEANLTPPQAPSKRPTRPLGSSDMDVAMQLEESTRSLPPPVPQSDEGAGDGAAH